MDFKRIILWVLFVFSLFMIWTNWQQYSAPVAPTQAVSATPTAPNTASSNATPSSPVSKSTDSTQPSVDTKNSNSEKVVVSSDTLELTFDTAGAQIIKANLLKHHDSKNIELPTTLLDNKDTVYTIQSGLLSSDTAKHFPQQNTIFKLVSTDKKLTADTLDVVFEATSDDIKLVRTYTLKKDSYDIIVKDQVTNLSSNPQSVFHYNQITHDSKKPESSGSNMAATYLGFALYTDKDKFEKVKTTDIDDNSAKFNNKSNDVWISFIQHYFVTAWVPEKGKSQNIEFRKVDNNLYAASLTETLGEIAPQQTVNTSAHLWIGPQDQKALTKIEPNLNTVVNYGWLSFIAKPMFALMSWINSVLGNWGWTIIVLTIIIKLLLYPLSAASYKSMAKMKNFAPRMQNLREQYKDDKQKLNAAMMELYRTEKINPLGGCFPILIQIPIFLTLYRVILYSVELRGAPWIGWITDLSVQDPYYILPILMILTMFLQMRLNPTPPDPIQAKVMMFMPLVFGGMMLFFPAGLVLYWTVNSILSIVQQWYNTKRFNQAANDKILKHK